MNINWKKRSHRVNLVELSSFPHKFVLSPSRGYRPSDSRRRQEANTEFDYLNVEPKSIGLRWNIRGNPNGPFTRPVRTHQQWLREESFDQDFMMPSRVREVLQSEGLEPVTIDYAIGYSERKHRHLKQLMEEENRLNQRRTLAPLPDASSSQISSQNNPGPASSRKIGVEPESPRYTAVGPSSETPTYVTATGKERRNPKARLLMNEINPDETDITDQYLSRALGQCIEDSFDHVQLEMDRAKWKADQHTERLFASTSFDPPRIVLVSSKITKCHLLGKVFRESSVLPIQYDFDTWTCGDIVEAISQRLEKYRRNCRAKSIMILCQGGPGYIYLLRNYVITPQKLHKPSYRGVVDLWKALGDFVSKMYTPDAAIHILGFKLTENEQGVKLVSMLQRLMYPNVVRLEAPLEDTEEGRAMIGLYFKYDRYKIWKMHQNTSVTEIDFAAEEARARQGKEVKRQSSSKHRKSVS